MPMHPRPMAETLGPLLPSGLRGTGTWVGVDVALMVCSGRGVRVASQRTLTPVYTEAVRVCSKELELIASGGLETRRQLPPRLFCSPTQGPKNPQTPAPRPAPPPQPIPPPCFPTPP